MASQGGEAEVDGAPPLVRPDKPMKFASLHHHSTFSYLDGYGLPEAHARRAAELGMTHLALTEHGNVSSHVQLEKAADKYSIDAIFGCELYCGEVKEEKRQRRKNHLTVLASTQTGYSNLLQVVSKGFSEGFYHEPTVSGQMLEEHKEGLIVLSGCQGSLLATSMIGGKNVPEEDASYSRAKRVAQRMRDHLGDAYYLEVQAFPELEKTLAINEGVARLSRELHIPMVATLDAHYTRPEEGEVQAILHNLRPGKKQTIEQQMQNWGYDVPLTPLTDKEIYDRLRKTGLTKIEAQGAILTTREIADRCNVRLPKVENLRFPLPAGEDDPRALLRKQLNDGWKRRGFGALPEEEQQRYIERVEYEYGLIESKGFVDYFLVVGDLVRWAKDVRTPEAPLGIGVGPARGSAAASLVCYLLRITEVNPMHFPNLVFERFIDINRHDLPDIDIDFDDALRWMIRDYLARTYGADRVGNIGTWTKFKGKNSLDDVARVFDIPEEQVKTVKNLIVTRSSGDLREASSIQDSADMFPQVAEVFEKYPELRKSELLEGNYKAMSTHAAGLLVANGPLTDFCAIYTRTNSDGEVQEVVSLDKYDAEYLNALKIDALGLINMGIINVALQYVGLEFDDMYGIDLADERTLAGFKKGDLNGIFQFDGRAMKSVNEMVKPDNFAEVCDINALARPGPLHSGATAVYADVKHGRDKPTHWHEIVDEITKHTQFQVVYQEQILQIVRNLGGFSWEEAARIRKIISKKRGEQEFNRQRDAFVDGAASHGMVGEDAHSVFSMLATAGAYAFNAAHCVSYGMLAYWTMYLKQRHPEAFLAAALERVDKGTKATREKVRMLLKDLESEDFGRAIPILPVSLASSRRTWSLDPNGEGILPGLKQIDGIGDVTADLIISEREEAPFDDWDDLERVKGIGPSTVEKVKEFASSDDPFKMLALTRRLDEWRERLAQGVEIKNGPFVSALPVPTHTTEEVPYEKASSNQMIIWIGVVNNRNLKDLWENHYSKTGKQLDRKTVKAPHKDQWVVMWAEDETDKMSITVNRFVYEKFKDRVWDVALDEDLILVRGIKYGIQANRALHVKDMWILRDPEEGEDEQPDESEQVA